jgi:hypothetical protein
MILRNLRPLYLYRYKENCITYKNGRYVAKARWNGAHCVLPTNYEICRKRAENTIERLSVPPHLL